MSIGGLVTAVAVTAVVMTLTAVVDWMMEERFIQDQTAQACAAQQVNTGAALNENDIKMAALTADYINRRFGGIGSKSVLDMGVEQRMAETRALTQELCELYHIDPVSILFVQDCPRNCATTASSARNISLNAVYMCSNREADIRCFLDTIVHELRHVVQISALHGNEYWQVPVERQKAWLLNLLPENYIKPAIDFEGYRKQPVELDAQAFALKAMKGVGAL